jgi:hypothetical protein
VLALAGDTALASTVLESLTLMLDTAHIGDTNPTSTPGEAQPNSAFRFLRGECKLRGG